MIITSQKWDGVTAPALPAGWTYDTNYATSVATGSVTPLSASNMLTTPTAADRTAYYDTPDAVSGQVRVSAAFTTDAPRTASGSDTSGAVFCRAANPASPSTRTYYYALIDFYAGQVVLAYYSAGTRTQLGVVGASLIGAYASPAGTWFVVTLTCDGPRISVTVQRQSDGYWLLPNGTWQAGAATCLAVTDINVAGSGYAGLFLNAGDVLGDVYTDNFLFESLSDPKQQIAVVPARPCWWLRD